MLIEGCYHSHGTITKDSKTNTPLDTPINYDNYVFWGYAAKDVDDKKEYLFGDQRVPHEEKVSVVRWQQFVGKNPQELQGKDVRFFYDNNKKFVGIQIIK